MHTILGMEKEGFIRCVENIQNNLTLSIAAKSIDRHFQIKHLMKSDPRFKHILHQFDPYHIAKGISKKMTKAQRRQVSSCHIIFYFTSQFVIFSDNFV